jgi:hypothetical protein
MDENNVRYLWPLYFDHEDLLSGLRLAKTRQLISDGLALCLNPGNRVKELQGGDNI